jgi:hypothetical protein
MDATLLPIAAAVATIATMLNLLRRRRLKEKYAVLWLVVALGVAVVAAWPETLVLSADLLGVQTPSNLLFFVAALVLLVVSVQLSSQVSQLEEETRSLAEETAILRLLQERVSCRHDGPVSGGATPPAAGVAE